MKTFLIQFILLTIVNFVIAQNKATKINHSNPNLTISNKIPKIFNFDNLPIKAERTISFTTDEASYIDLDISPDGKTLVCSFLGDLFTIPATGGNARQLTRGLAINKSPVWSPDGKYIAYSSDATGMCRLHIMDTLGTFHKVLAEDRYQMPLVRPIWLPDNKQIIGNIVYDISGVKTEPFKNISDIISYIGYSANSHCIYYLIKTRGNYTLIKLNRNTGHKVAVFEFKRVLHLWEIRNMRVSNDDRWLSYIKYNSGSLDSLQLIDLGSHKEKFLAPLSIKFAPPMDQSFCFSKDSKYIFIGYGGKVHRIDIETGDNRIIPFVADVKIDMGTLNYNRFKVSLTPFHVKYIRSVNRSPDGKHIVFSALNRIYVMDLPNGVPRVLVKQNTGQYQPTYSPDGNWITYITWNAPEGGHVWKVRSTGGIPEQLTQTTGLYQHPSWSPDEKMIIVTKGNNISIQKVDEAQIQTISIADRSIEIIADSVSLFSIPTFFPDNKTVLYCASKTVKGNKISVLVSHEISENKKKILFSANKESNNITCRLISLSPDGKNVVFLFNENLYLVPLNNTSNTQTNLADTLPALLIRFARGITDPTWEEGGKIISWLSANKYCRIDPRKIIKAAKQQPPNKSNVGLAESNIIDIDLPIDNLIDINLKAGRLYSKEMIALKNANIITMRNNEIIESGTVLIKNGRLTYVGESEKVTIPKGTKVIDMKGKYIIPGLIDMHSHLGILSPPDLRPQQSWQQLINFAYGITTIRDPFSSFESFGSGELVETGQSIGPRSFTVGRAITPDYALTSLHEANIIVNNRIKMGATLIKQYLNPTRLQRQLLLVASKSCGVNMTNEEVPHPLYWLGMIKDGTTGIEHMPTWGEVYHDIISLIAKSGTYLTPTLQTGDLNCKNYFTKIYLQSFLNQNGDILPSNLISYLQKSIDNCKFDSIFLYNSRIMVSINKAGGKVLMGTHGEYQGIGAHYELWALQMGGLTNYETLKTGTIYAAEGLGMQKDLGSIEVGKIADLIVLDKNPLEDIHNSVSINYIMKAGILYDRKTIMEKLK
jgi:Tol biopolymer transport system component